MVRRLVVSLFMLLFVCTAGSNLLAEKGVYKFDLGPKGSPVRLGFIGISKNSLYRKDIGYGWENTKRLTDKDRRKPDSLCQDWAGKWVTSGVEDPARNAFTFKADLPDGSYLVYLIVGDDSEQTWKHRIPSYIVEAEGKEALRDIITKDNFYSKDYHYRYFYQGYQPGESIWEKYFIPRFRPRTFPVEVGDGQLNLKFIPQRNEFALEQKNTHPCTINTIIIYSAEDKIKVEKEIKNLEEARKQEFEKKFFKEVKHVETTPAPALSKKDKKKGYILFNHDFMSPIFPNTIPKEDEIGEELRAFATLGEFEPVTFGIYPLKDVGKAKVLVEDLKDEKGNVFAKENIKINVVRYLSIRGSANKPTRSQSHSYQVVPWFLMPGNTLELQKDFTRQIWLTIKVAENAIPGNYQGRVIFKPEKARKTVIPLKLKLLPVKLMEAKGIDFGLYASGRKIEDMINMREHGMTTMSAYLSGLKFTTDENGNVDVDVSSMGPFVKNYIEAGYTSPIPYFVGGRKIALSAPHKFVWRDIPEMTDVFRTQYARALKAFYRRFREHKDWPEAIFYIADEWGEGGLGVAKPALEFLKFIKELKKEVPGGFTTCASMITSTALLYSPYLDINIVNNSLPLSAKNLKKIRDAGAEVGLVNVGTNRFTWGYYVWKTGCKLRLQWRHYCTSGDPFSSFDGMYGDNLSLVLPGPEGILDTLQWENVREGVDDYKCLYTLSSLIKQANTSNIPDIISKAGKAQKVLDEIISTVDISLDKYYVDTGQQTGTLDASKSWKGDKYNQLRWRILREIIQLDSALNKDKYKK